jgi:hypothetical protein
MTDASMSGGVVPGCPVELDKVSWREAARCLRELTQLKRGKHITKETSLRGNDKTDRLPKGKYATPNALLEPSGEATPGRLRRSSLPSDLTAYDPTAM